ncbi:hypothetical protein [Azospirillum palustre]
MSHTLRVGHIDLSFHDDAREVESILGAHRHRIESAAALHEEMFQRMVHGEIDLLVSAWLPASHDACLAPFEREVTKVTVLYEPYCIWAVPNYLPEDEVAEDDKGCVYAGDYEHGTIRRFTDGRWETIVEDPRILWPDTLSVGTDEYLYFTANQFHRQAGFHDGRGLRRPAYQLLRFRIDAGPVLLKRAAREQPK